MASVTAAPVRVTSGLLLLLLLPQCLIQGVGAHLPPNCLRLYTGLQKLGQWLDVCDSNPSIPESFARQVKSVEHAGQGNAQGHILVYLLYDKVQYSGSLKLLVENSSLNLLSNNYVIRSVLLQCLARNSYRLQNCAELEAGEAPPARTKRVRLLGQRRLPFVFGDRY